ncbi:MAG: exosome complex RNA-binding protein Csl4 [Candidatus Thermoplasmatota archaeon]|nr:exosome complex RNA-binding protein Csl4 [Candidatus Thermoplasmatota archaeon]
MTSKLVFPGDELAVAEEFMPGEGTYEEDGMVYAAWMGEAHLDAANYEASVTPSTNQPATLEPRDQVIGRVRGMRKSFAMVEVQAKVDEPDREVASDTNGTLHIAKISPDYLDQIEDAFRVGDLIRAEVLEVEPAVQLSTKAIELGVLLARCPMCRTVMEAKGHGLVCPSCDWKSRAKLAVDYGDGRLEPPTNARDRYEERKAEHKEHGIRFPATPVHKPESGRGRRGRKSRGKKN